MELGRLGVWYSTDKLDGSQLRDFVRTVENNEDLICGTRNREAIS